MQPPRYTIPKDHLAMFTQRLELSLSPMHQQ